MERVADYMIVRPLSGGNNGQLYVAKCPERLPIEAEFVAVKVLGENGGPDAFRRMTRELKLFASVRSPHLVTLYDAGQDGNIFYYSLEYFPMGSLEQPAEPVSRQIALRAMSNVARAAHALHEAGVAHRDIRPGNVLLHEGGAKLSDLGLAQVLQPGITVTGMAGIGSVEYMDPGMLRGDRPSRASDIWSLGVTLHRALTGDGVYGELPAGDPLLILRKVLSTPPTISDKLSAGDASLITACLDTDVARRPRTAGEVADFLDQLATAA